MRSIAGRLRFQPSRPAPSLPHQVPNEHAENTGTRKRRPPEEPPVLDPLESTPAARKGNEQYVVETIGSADDGAMDADGVTILNFAQGQARAREIALARRQAAVEPPPAEYTVKACAEDYLNWMEHNRKTA